MRGMNKGLASLSALAAAALLAQTGAAQAPARTGTRLVTFTKDVARILQRSCQACHRPESMAPMSFLNYEDVRAWARAIKQKVSAREMPPWYIDRTVGITKFVDDPSLSDQEIQTIAAWVDGGAQRGAAGDMPPPREFQNADIWHIGKPDLVVKSTRHTVPATGSDWWGDYIVETGLTEDRYLKAVETKPSSGAKKVTHHAVTYLLQDEGTPDLVGRRAPQTRTGETGGFLNEYAVGKNGDVFPEGAGRLVKAGAKVRFNMHYHPVGEETVDQSEVALVFYPKGYKPKYYVEALHTGDAEDVQPLLPAGSMIHVISWHNNTASNRYNPDPRNWAGFGQRSIDDMAFAWVNYVWLTDEDFKAQVEERTAKDRKLTTTQQQQ